MPKPPPKPDIVHDEPGATMPRHLPSLADLCDICTARRERGVRITKIHEALVEFGYGSLTRGEVSDAYDAALRGDAPGGDIIRLMVRSQLEQAGLVEPR
jgi:hypothetical protein